MAGKEKQLIIRSVEMMFNFLNGKPKFFLLFLMVIALLSCNNRKEFEQYQKFEKQSWHRFNIVKFEVPVSDIRNPYNIELIIRHLPEFIIKDLPTNVTIYTPSGEMRTSEHILNFTGTDGKNLSKCLGDLCDITFNLREDFVFPEPGTYQIEIENKWPKLELPGILEVGLILEKSQY
jgi:gliding motility-associated lipoprotein GldH